MKDRTDETMDQQDPVWVHRPLLSTRPVLEWLHQAGVRKVMPLDQLHLTQATVRTPVSWKGLTLREDELVIPAGLKTVQIFAYTIKALTFGHPAVKERHEELLGIFPQMDHPILRPHVSLYKGGRMPRGDPYTGELVFGPEVAEVFDANNTQGIKHVQVGDLLGINQK